MLKVRIISKDIEVNLNLLFTTFLNPFVCSISLPPLFPALKIPAEFVLGLLYFGEKLIVFLHLNHLLILKEAVLATKLSILVAFSCFFLQFFKTSPAIAISGVSLWMTPRLSWLNDDCGFLDGSQLHFLNLVMAIEGVDEGLYHLLLFMFGQLGLMLLLMLLKFSLSV